MEHLVTVGNITKRVSILMEGAEHKESFDQEERRVLGFQELLH